MLDSILAKANIPMTLIGTAYQVFGYLALLNTIPFREDDNYWQEYRWKN